ncbi:hypothetical protein [Limnohabitans sp. Jir61]|uniref:hypothetical protein n=1 Tax=Limnohabitans sp. Jir61 TaxID=1826168 RepID=UPI0011B20AFC|nr:hypothetical protein [Limnohabitans sp. Jir61]
MRLSWLLAISESHLALHGLMRYGATTCFFLIGLLSWPSAHALLNTDDTSNTQWSYQLGVDTWRISASTETDSNLGLVDERSFLLLPDTHTERPYKSASLYGWVVGNKPLTGSTKFSFKAQANQSLGARLDEAQIETHISPFLGFRFGVVDYKTSWCRTYEADSVWIRDVEPICNFQNFRDVTGGAPGVQLFVRKPWGAYLTQFQLGVYRPLMFDYAAKEFGDFVPAPSPNDPYIVESNKKAGFNINVLNLNNAVEARLSVIKGTHRAFTPDDDKLGTTKQSNQAVYAALSFPISTTVFGRFTRFHQSQDATCLSDVAAVGACNLNYNFKKEFTSVEATSRVSSQDMIGIGLSETIYRYTQSVFLSYDFFFKNQIRETNIKQLNLAWRHDWAKGVFTSMQFIKALHATELTSSAVTTRTPSNGYAIGLRFGYQY